MDLRVFTEPQQGATYDDLLRVARATEDLGFEAFFRSDHYLGMGRVELGLGAGWYEAEHTAYGISFPGTRERFDRFEEQLAVVTGLWRTAPGERFGHDGAHYPVTDSPALPKPVQQPHPPIIVGGLGKRRTPELAARYADEFNLPFVSLETTRAQFARVRAACTTIDRDPDELCWSNALVLCCGDTEGEVRQRADAIGRDVAELRENGLAGSPDEVVERIGQYAEAGAQRVYLQVLDLDDLDHLDLVAAKVMPQLSA
jgi:alkanesulfonate monooxygenase